jgi:hypothetical protein
MNRGERRETNTTEENSRGGKRIEEKRKQDKGREWKRREQNGEGKIK